MDFSLFYFSSNDAKFTRDKYELYLEGARFADKNGFCAIWTPERHFHSFGGLYPNPATLASALAMITKEIRLRAGSVVLPLHSPVRIAEEWSIVDNLSNGRVDISVTVGWNKNDFVLAPQNYEKRQEYTFTGVEIIQKLWRGEAIVLPNGLGELTEVFLFPQPQQENIDIWLTCSGSKERFIDAGKKGLNVLTALLFQNIDELAQKIQVYRQTRKESGYDPQTGKVTVMLHTFIGKDTNGVYEVIRTPFLEYLKTSANFWSQQEKSWKELPPKRQEQALEFAFRRYAQTAAMFGTVSSCQAMVTKMKEIGVDEIACLIDFGVENNTVLENLQNICELKAL